MKAWTKSRPFVLLQILSFLAGFSAVFWATRQKAVVESEKEKAEQAAEKQRSLAHEFCDPLCLRAFRGTFFIPNGSYIDEQDCVCQGRLEKAISYNPVDGTITVH